MIRSGLPADAHACSAVAVPPLRRPRVMRVEGTRVRLGRLGTPSDVLRLLRDDERPFLLVGDWAGSGAIAGSEPLGGGPDHPLPGEGVDPGFGRFVGGGWFGYLGFALGGRVERLPPAPPRPQPLPECDVAFYDHVLRMAT